MSKDNITIAIASVILLICLNNAKGYTELGTNELGDPWIRLIKPVDGEEVYKKIVCESEVSNPEEIYCVMYYFFYKGVWHGDTTWVAYEPPYHFEYQISFLKPGDEVAVAAASYIEVWTPTGRSLIPIAVSEDVVVRVRDNDKPLKPDTPSGRSIGAVEIEYTYRSSASDPDNDDIYYLFDWGDGTDSGWLGPYSSNEIVEARHAWKEKNSYTIKVKARDVYGFESEWSDPLSVAIVRTKIKEQIDKFLKFNIIKLNTHHIDN